MDSNVKHRLISWHFNFSEQVYHFCHGYGKQDTFYCPYGTIFNEYLGTCDYKNNVKCSGSGEGYKGPLPKPHHEPHHDSYHPPPHDDYHAPHQPYKTHVSYHEHEQYHPPHDSYGAPPHDAYGPPPHEAYEPPHHAYDPHEDSYHEPPPYHIDSYKHEDGYNGDGFRGEKHSPFSEGFGSGFGESHGFGPGFVSQDLRRSDNERSREPPSRPHRGSRRRETPRNLNFDLHKEDFKDIPAEGEFGFDGLKAYGFGLRL